MKKNQVRVFKDFLFRVFKSLEIIFAYNRMRRERWLIKQANIIPNGAKVLDVGAGGCPHREKFNHCEYLTQDFVQLSDSQIQTQDGYGKIDYISDILDIPVPDSSFDVILCTEVIEHVPNPILAIKEFARILKSGGTLLITAPLQSGLHQEPFHFYGGYTKYWYEKFLTDNNFSELNIEANGSLYTTYFAVSSTVFRSFLEVIMGNKKLLQKLISFNFIVYLFSCFLDSQSNVLFYVGAYL